MWRPAHRRRHPYVVLIVAVLPVLDVAVQASLPGVHGQDRGRG